MEQKIKILLVEDEKMLAEILSDTLTDRKFDITLAYDGEQALKLARNNNYEVIVTDVMMPKIDGFTLVKRLRGEGCVTPILFLTALSTTEDVVRGFEAGGNDFLKKPFAIDELIVRIKALAGRAKGGESEDVSIYDIGNFKFSPKESQLTINGLHISLAARESAVLLRLCRNIEQTVESSAILRELWGDDTFFNLRSLNVYISRLRHHLAADPNVEIVNIRGIGYKLKIGG